ncbi:MAG: AAA family ATPase [Lachnospiraceae bacterium]|nr:AAA family ATPase [Lachnospiraceae bacterium]
MGTYLNPGKTAYEEAINSEIFIDKSEMIMFLNSVLKTKQKYVSVSRPRRFGKTMAADMICAYYDREAKSRELFEKRLLAKCEPIIARNQTLTWDGYLGHFDVIRIVMTDFIKSDIDVPDALGKLKGRILDELNEAYPDVKYDENDFFYSLDKFYRKTGYPFVIVIDEWDSVFRERKEDKDGQKHYLDFLRDWMKDKAYIALAYMTGILPIKKYGKHSALNMFTEYSMMFPREMAPYTGFTEEEVKRECKKYGMDYGEVSDWYDGYTVSDRIPPEKREEYREGKYEGHKISIYSPLSVVESMTTGIIKNYWNKTETFEALSEFISMNQDGLKDAIMVLMDGGKVKVDTSTYQNDMTTFTGRDDVLSLLIHLGYLGFDDEKSEVYIPNREILDEFKAATKDGEWVAAFEAFRISLELIQATWAEDTDKVAELLEKAHNRADNKTYNDEAALSYTILYAYYAAEKYYTMLPELDTGKGYADRVYIPRPQYADKPVLIIELKYEKDADGAIAQIKRQQYPDRLEAYKGNILLVGINYNKDAKNTGTDYKHHTCEIDRA